MTMYCLDFDGVIASFDEELIEEIIPEFFKLLIDRGHKIAICTKNLGASVHLRKIGLIPYITTLIASHRPKNEQVGGVIALNKCDQVVFIDDLYENILDVEKAEFEISVICIPYYEGLFKLLFEELTDET